MSAVSKIPQTRPSRIAGPSKLPSRILRPTFTNKPTAAIPSFVNSAKQLEVKKESLIEKDERHSVNSNAKEVKHRHSPSNLPGKTGKYLENRTSVDCNANRNIEADLEKVTETETLDSHDCCHEDRAESVKSVQGSPSTVNKAKGTTERGTTCKPTYTVNKTEDNITSPVMSAALSEKSQEESLPTFRSMKPGYFMQKVNAIKNSQQKNIPEKQSNIASIFSKYKLGNPETSKIGALTAKPSGKVNENRPAPTSSLVKPMGHNQVPKQSTTVPRSRMMQPASVSKVQASDQHHSPSKAHVTRAEKRKKYLEARASKTVQADSHASRSDSQTSSVNDQRQEEATVFQNGPAQSSQPGFSFIRRPFTSTRQQRNAKIARPVVRPKSALSPTVAKSFLPSSSQLSTAHEPVSHQHREKDVQKSSRAEGLEKVVPSASKISYRSASSDSSEKLHDNDRQSVTSAVSEESGYGSVASSVFLDNKIKGSKGLSLPSTAFGQRLKWASARPHQSDPGTLCATESNYETNERSPSLGINHSQHQTKKGEAEQQSETEGNYAAEHRYGITESRHIRSSHGSSSSDYDNPPDRESPTTEGESENTSDSSAETVIPKNRSPVALPGKTENQKHQNQGKQGKEEDPDSSFPDEVFNEKQDSVEEDPADKLDHNQTRVFHFSSDQHETTFTSTCSPEPNNIGLIVTPNSNSSLKAKKRKTDSILMSPLQPDEETSTNDPALTQAKFEKEILFECSENDHSPDEEFDSEDEEDLSALIDLPSLHESALMADYDEDECEDQSSEVHNGHTDSPSPIPMRREPVTPVSVQTAQTNVINKLLSNGLDGIIKTREELSDSPSSINNSRFMNGHSDHENCIKSCSGRQRINHTSNSINEAEILQECRALKVTLQQLYFILERNEEENAMLHRKNERLNQKVTELTNELNALSVTSSPSFHKESQTTISTVDASTGMETPEDSEEKDHETSTPVSVESPRWYRTEVSTKLQSNIEEATEEIKYLKTLRGDFDSRIHSAEKRLNCALELLHQ